VSAVITCDVPLLGFCAYGSGIGKTTLLTSLIPVLTARGLNLSVIKHAHHTFDIDHPGKDSYRIREAGAVQTMLGSRRRWALMTEMSRISERKDDLRLAELLPHMDTSLVELILVEGFKQEPIPKIEIFRPSLNKPLLASTDTHIIAVATDGPAQTALPQLDLNDSQAIADFVQAWLVQKKNSLKIVTTQRT
jgi:molybdopterin-guanine dinucleotide biosynthesis protein B